MKIVIAIVIAMVLSATVPAQAQKYVADASKSELVWTGKKVLGSHNGKIKLKSGEFVVEKNKIKSGTFIIDMTTITVDDLPAGDANNSLTGHLKSDDFFSVATHPESRLVLTGSTPLQNGKAKVKGNLTIKGKTHPVEFEGVQQGNTFTASVVVDRTNYDVRYGSGKFFKGLGDNMINDNFTIDVKLVTEKK